MKKNRKKLLFILAATLTCGYFSIHTSNEVVCGNIEALTSGGDSPDDARKRPVYTQLTSLPERDADNWAYVYKYENHKKTSYCEAAGNWQDLLKDEFCYLY